MIYREPNFLASYDFAPTPTPPHLQSVGSTRDTKEDWESETTCWQEKGEEGMGKEPNHTTARKPGPL